MSDYKLAIKIAGELDGSLASAVNGAKSMLESLTGSAGRAVATGATTLMKGNLAGITAVAAAAGKVVKEAFTQGMDFENAMADLAGTAGIEIGSEAYQAYEQAARQVGATTNKTATESAEALKYMALAGWDVNDSIQALDGMVKLSSASGMEMSRTSDLVTDSMGALGLTMDDYARYMDFVATADAAANYTAEAFMETMIRSGGAARTLTMGYEDLATAAGVLANNGEKGSQAGTSLNSILRRLATNGTAITALADNGISMFDEATGEFRGFQTVLEDINSVMDNMTTEERVGLLSDLAGRYVSQFQYLLDSVKEGGDWGKLMGDEFADVAGNLEQRYATATNTLQGSLDILKSAASDFGIEIYQSMMGGSDGVQEAVGSATDTINRLKEALQMDGAIGLADQIGNEIGNIASSIETDGASAIESATAFVESLYQSLGETENAEAIGGAVSSILTSLGTGFIESTGDYAVMAGNIVTGIVNGLNEGDAGSQLGEAITSAVGKIGDWIGENGGDLGAAAGQLIASLAGSLAEHADELIPAGINIIGGLVQGLIQGAAKLVGAIPSIMGSLVSGVASALPALISAGKGVGLALKEGAESVAIDLNEIFHFDNDYGELTEGAKEAFTASAEEMAAAIQDVWNNTTFAFDEGINKYAPQGENLTKDYVQAWVDAGATIEQVQQEVSDTLAANMGNTDVTQAVQNAADIYGELSNKAAEVVAANQEAAAAAQETAEAIDEIGQSGETTSEAMETVNAAMESLAGSGGLEDIASELDGMASSLEETQSAADGLKESLTFDGFAGDLADDLLSADDIQARADEVSTAMQTIADNVSQSMSTLESTFSTFGSTVGESLSSAADGIAGFQDTMTVLSESVGTAFDGVSTSVSTALDGVATAMESQGAAATAAADGIVQDIQAAFEGINLSSSIDISGFENLESSISGVADSIRSIIDDLQGSLSLDGVSGGSLDGLLDTSGIQAQATEVSAAMQTMQATVSTAMTAMAASFAGFGSNISMVFATASASFSGFEMSIAAMGASVASTFDGIVAAVSASMAAMAAEVQAQGAAAIASAQSTAQGIMAAFQSIDLSSVAANMMAGLTNGIQAGGAAAVAAAQSVASQVAAAMQSALAIHSPSRVTYEIGENTTAGFTNAIQDAIPEATSAGNALAMAGGYGMGGQEESVLSRFNRMDYPGAEISRAEQPQQQQMSMGPVTFSPNITIQGNADQGNVQEALQWGFDQFEKMMERYMWKKGREAFAT